MRPSLAKVCYDNKLTDITPQDYATMEAILKVTGPVRSFEKKLQQEEVPTISLVLAGTVGLIGVLEKLKVNAETHKLEKCSHLAAKDPAGYLQRSGCTSALRIQRRSEFG